MLISTNHTVYSTSMSWSICLINTNYHYIHLLITIYKYTYSTDKTDCAITSDCMFMNVHL